jgi:hypothetical protein
VKDHPVDIIHPYFTEEDDNEQKAYRQIKATWDGELRYGVPHGLGYIKYKHEEEVKHEEGEEETQGDYMSFRGFGVMNRGKLDGGSCLLERGDGFRYSFANMKDGRPFGPGRYYNDDESEEVVSDPSSPQAVKGWAGYIGPFQDAFWHSPGPKDAAYPDLKIMKNRDSVRSSTQMAVLTMAHGEMT